MRINYNATAMLAVNRLNVNDENLSVSTGKLSSGYKINRAKDNPSGYAMSRRMHAQLEGLLQAKDNSDTGVNILKSVDGALTEVHDMVQRLNELAIKGANGTLSDGDRELVDEEMQKLKEEIQRISDTFEFNGQKLLDGSFQLKGYTNENTIKVAEYDERIASGVYQFDLSLFKDAGLYNVEGNFVEEVFSTWKRAIEVPADPDNETIPAAPGTIFPPDFHKTVTIANNSAKPIPVTFPDGKIEKAYISDVNGTIVTLEGPLGFEVSLDISKEFTDPLKVTDDKAKAIEVNFTGLGAMTMQVGANEGQQIKVEIPNVGIKGLRIDTINAKTKESALEAIKKASAAVDKLSGIRSKIGAYQNRLESIVTSNEINHENMTGAYSNILDVDMSEEYTKYSTYQVLSQASTSVLAQANERPSQVLQLLQ